jgi:hypothetical protein
MPTDEVIAVPEEWLLHRCSHRPDGLRLQLVVEHHDEKEMAAERSVWGVSVWRDSIDATKNIGFPARESGKYGSHPSHDAFNDESDP